MTAKRPAETASSPLPPSSIIAHSTSPPTIRRKLNNSLHASIKRGSTEDWDSGDYESQKDNTTEEGEIVESPAAPSSRSDGRRVFHIKGSDGQHGSASTPSSPAQLEQDRVKLSQVVIASGSSTPKALPSSIPIKHHFYGCSFAKVEYDELGKLGEGTFGYVC